MSKLNIKDINRIAEEVEKQEIEFLKRRLEDKYAGWYQECLHENAGDRE